MRTDSKTLNDTYDHLDVLLQIIRHVRWDILGAVVWLWYPVEDLKICY